MSDQAVRSRSLGRYAPWLLIAALLTVHAATLLRYPPPFVDEAWAANRGWAFLQTGKAFGMLDSGVFELYEGYWTYLPVIPTFLQALPLWLVGYPALWPLRLVSLAAGAVLLGACYSLGRRAADRDVALLAVALTALSAAFIYSAHLARWDILVAAAGYSALSIQVSGNGGRIGPAFLVGLLLGTAFEIHPHACVFMPVSLALYGWRYGRSVWKQPAVWGWAVGLLSGFGIYWALHLMRYPETFLALARLGHGATHTPPLATLNPVTMTTGLLAAAGLVQSINPFTAFGYVVAALWLVMRRTDRPRLAGLLATLLFLGVGLLIRNKFRYYAIYVTPALDLVLAAALVSAFRAPIDRSLRLALAGLLLVPLLLGVTLNLFLLSTNGARDFERTLARLQPLVEPDDVVMGAQTYWFGLTDRQYFSWEQLVYYKRQYPDASLAEGIEYFRPDIFVVDGQVDQYLVDEGAGVGYSGHLNLPRRDFLAFMASRATLVADFDGARYGRILVFRIHWNQPRPRRAISGYGR